MSTESHVLYTVQSLKNNFKKYKNLNHLLLLSFWTGLENQLFETCQT
jgi:hypothetical protein